MIDLFTNGKRLATEDDLANFPKEKRTLTDKDDLNNIIEDGIYRIDSSYALPKNSDFGWAIMIVKKFNENDIKQMMLNGSDVLFRDISISNNYFPKFQRLLTENDYKKLQSQIDSLTKNQNGGVTSLPIYRYTSTVMEVA